MVGSTHVGTWIRLDMDTVSHRQGEIETSEN